MNLESDVPIYLRNLPPPNETFDHRSLLMFFAFWIKPQVYLELGVRNGYIITEICKFAKRCVGVDLQKASGLEAFPVEFYEMSTSEFAKRLPGLNLKIDMAFIDADHSHEASLRDFDNIFPYVSNDGLIFLHDTYPIHPQFLDQSLCADSYKTAWYIRKNYGDRCEILTIPVQPGLSIVRKSSRQLEWMAEDLDFR